MLAKNTLIAAAALAFALAVPSRAQDSPSLGDLARQAQKDKEKDKASKPAARVLTNDDLPSSSAMPASLGGGLGQLSSPSGAKPGSALAPAEKLAMIESFLDQLDTVDRATFIHNILSERDVNFPGRAKWEERMYAAKGTYVKEARELVRKAKQIVASAESMKGSAAPDPAQQKELGASVGNLVRDAVRMDSEFQAVMIEGRDLAAQANQH